MHSKKDRYKKRYLSWVKTLWHNIESGAGYRTYAYPIVVSGDLLSFLERYGSIPLTIPQPHPTHVDARNSVSIESLVESYRLQLEHCVKNLVEQAYNNFFLKEHVPYKKIFANLYALEQLYIAM